MSPLSAQPVLLFMLNEFCAFKKLLFSPLPTAKTVLHLLHQELTDNAFCVSVKEFLLKPALVLQCTSSHLLFMHFLSEVFIWQSSGDHLIDAAAQRPPVHRFMIILLPKDLRGHVASGTSLRTHREESGDEIE